MSKYDVINEINSERKTTFTVNYKNNISIDNIVINYDPTWSNSFSMDDEETGFKIQQVKKIGNKKIKTRVFSFKTIDKLIVFLEDCFEKKTMMFGETPITF